MVIIYTANFNSDKVLKTNLKSSSSFLFKKDSKSSEYILCPIYFLQIDLRKNDSS